LCNLHVSAPHLARLSKWLLFIIIIIGISPLNLLAQKSSFTISGTVHNATNGEVLIGANVYVKAHNIGTSTDAYGFYSLALPPTISQDTVSVIYSYIGFQPITHQFILSKDTSVNIELLEYSSIETTQVSANSNQERINSTKIGTEKVTAKEAKEIVALLGESDMIRVLQLKPGIQSGAEGSSGLYVRGGGVDQNHFILDEATIYNPNHFLGLFSVFNTDITNNIELYKAGFPPRFGGKLSSIIDVHLREGNRKRIEINGGLGVLSSRLSLEGPIVKNKGSFIIAGRRTYVDAFMHLINNSNTDNPNWTNLPLYNFYDLNAKLSYDLTDKDKLFLSGYFGRDKFNINNQLFSFDLGWGNTAATLRWNRIVTPKMTVNTSFTFSDYVYKGTTAIGNVDITLSSGIRDLNLKTDWLWVPSHRHSIRFGITGTYHKFSVGQFSAQNGNDVNLQTGSIFNAAEGAFYVSDDWEINHKIKLLAGIRVSGFYNQKKGYGAIEPRFVFKYSIIPKLAFKGSYTRMTQYLHLVATSSSTLPTDIWYPSTSVVPPQYSDLVAVSFSYALGKDFFIKIEGFYKWLHQQVDFREGARLFTNDHLDQEFVFGKGRSYGTEFYIEKRNGNLRGWIGYTLSWTRRQFDLINNGEPFYPRQDRRHDITAVITWDIPWTSPKFPLTLTASWIYGTGTAISVPTKRYVQTGITYTNPFSFVPIYKKRGGFRLPDYHRLDLGVIWKLFPQSKKRFESDLTISVYNVYDRRNPFFMYIKAVSPGGNNTTQIPEKFEARLVSLLPILPSITWNFKW